jgi:hypothetical protein
MTGLTTVALWEQFSDEVRSHVAEYAALQYSDSYTTLHTPEQCVTAIAKYVNRFGKNMRGPTEQVRDMLKIAHYAQIAHYLMTKGVEDD